MPHSAPLSTIFGTIKIDGTTKSRWWGISSIKPDVFSSAQQADEPHGAS